MIKHLRRKIICIVSMILVTFAVVSFVSFNTKASEQAPQTQTVLTARKTDYKTTDKKPTYTQTLNDNNELLNKVYDKLNAKKDPKKEIKENFQKSTKSIATDVSKLVTKISEGELDFQEGYKIVSSLITTVAACFGPQYGVAAEIAFKIIDTFISLINKAHESTGMAANDSMFNFQDKVEKAFNQIMDRLSDIQFGIDNLSNDIHSVAESIVEKIQNLVLESDAKKTVDTFLYSTTGNFSYLELIDCLYSSNTENSLYYDLVTTDYNNQEDIKYYYDKLYTYLSKSTKMFMQYLVPSLSGSDSILKAYYKVVSSDNSFLENGLTAEGMAIKFGEELFESYQFACDTLRMCYMYQALQITTESARTTGQIDNLTNKKYYYTDKDFIKYSTIEAEYDKISSNIEKVKVQVLKDLCSILGMDRSYIAIENFNGNYALSNKIHDISFYEDGDTKYLNPANCQTVFLNLPTDSIMSCLDLDPNKLIFRTYSYDEENHTSSLNDIKTKTLGVFTKEERIELYNKPITLYYEDIPLYTVTFVTSSKEVFNGGDGTYDMPYLINTPEQFIYMANHLEKDACYELINDLDFANYAYIPADNYDENGNLPSVIIANEKNPFNGVFNGNGHRISNINIYSDIKKENVNECYKPTAGLFGIIGENGIVKDLTISRITVNSDYSRDNFTMDDDLKPFTIGCIAGENKGTISNIKIENSTKNELSGIKVNRLKDCDENKNTKVLVGGIAGKNSGTIEYCVVDGLDIVVDSIVNSYGNPLNLNKNEVYVAGIAGFSTINSSISYAKVTNNTCISCRVISYAEIGIFANPTIKLLQAGITANEDGYKYINNCYSDVNFIVGRDFAPHEAYPEEYSEKDRTLGIKNAGKCNGTIGARSFENADYLQGKYFPIYCPITDELNFTTVEEKYYYNDDYKKIYDKYVDLMVQLVWEPNPSTIDRINSDPVCKAIHEELVNYLNLLKMVNADTKIIDGNELYIAFEIGYKKYKRKQVLVEEAKELEKYDSLIIEDNESNFYYSRFNYTISCEDYFNVQANQKYFDIDKLNISFDYKESNSINHTANSIINYYGFNTSRYRTDEDCLLERPERTLVFFTINIDGQKQMFAKEVNIKINHYIASSISSLNLDREYDLLNGNNVIDFIKGNLNEIRIQYNDGVYEDITVNKDDLLVELYTPEDNTLYINSPDTKYIKITYQNEDFVHFNGSPMSWIEKVNVYCSHDFEYHPEMSFSGSCIEKAYRKYVCTACGETYTITGGYSGHNYVVESGTPATCSCTGTTEKVTCSVCGEVFKNSELIQKLPHKYEKITKNDGTFDDEYHICINGDHKEPHQFMVKEFIDEDGNLCYEYYCLECGFKQNKVDYVTLTTQYGVPTVYVTDGYYLSDGDQVVVYVYLVNNPGIYGGTFGIRYSENLELVGDPIEGDLGFLLDAKNPVYKGYNFLMLDTEKMIASDNYLLKLTFKVLETQYKDGKPVESQINIVYGNQNNGSNKYEGGFILKEDGKRKNIKFITRPGTIKKVKHLPGDVNNDSIVDIMDALAIAYSLIGDNNYKIKQEYADVNLSGTVDLWDVYDILCYTTGKYGSHLSDSTIRIFMELNGYENNEIKPLEVDFYQKDSNGEYITDTDGNYVIALWDILNQYNEKMQREGYTFAGWKRKFGDNEYIDYSSTIDYDFAQRMQTIYADWNRNKVELMFNNGQDSKTYIYGDYEEIDLPEITKKADAKYTSYYNNEEKDNHTVSYYMLYYWELDGIEYTDSSFDLRTPNIGNVKLNAIWNGYANAKVYQKPASLGYESISLWTYNDNGDTVTNENLSSLLDPNKTLELKGNLEEIKYKVYFDDELSSNTYSIFDNTLVPPTKRGYEFKGWKNGTSYVDVEKLYQYGEKENNEWVIRLTSTWEAIIYTVNIMGYKESTLKSDESTYFSQSVLKTFSYYHNGQKFIFVEQGSNIPVNPYVAQDELKNMYDILGVYEKVENNLKNNASGSKCIYTLNGTLNEISELPSNKTISLYVLYKPKKYTVTINTKGIVEGTPKSNTSVKSAYNASAYYYHSQDKVSITTSTPNDTIYLPEYVIMEANTTYRFKFNVSGGSTFYFRLVQGASTVKEVSMNSSSSKIEFTYKCTETDRYYFDLYIITPGAYTISNISVIKDGFQLTHNYYYNEIISAKIDMPSFLYYKQELVKDKVKYFDVNGNYCLKNKLFKETSNITLNAEDNTNYKTKEEYKNYTYIASYSEMMNKSIMDFSSNKSYMFINDIDCGGVTWTPINNACTIYGKYHSIYNFRIDVKRSYSDGTHEKQDGFFSINDGTIEELILGNRTQRLQASFKYSNGWDMDTDMDDTPGSIEGDHTSSCGLLVGLNNNQIKKCQVINAYLFAKYRSNKGKSTTRNLLQVGGLVGINKGMITDSKMIDSKIEGEGGVKYDGQHIVVVIGGIVGYTESSVNNCKTDSLQINGTGRSNGNNGNNAWDPLLAIGFIAGVSYNVSSVDNNCSSKNITCHYYYFTHYEHHGIKLNKYKGCIGGVGDPWDSNYENYNYNDSNFIKLSK